MTAPTASWKVITTPSSTAASAQKRTLLTLDEVRSVVTDFAQRDNETRLYCALNQYTQFIDSLSVQVKNAAIILPNFPAAKAEKCQTISSIS